MAMMKKEPRLIGSEIIRALLRDVDKHYGRKTMDQVAGSLQIIYDLTNLNTAETAAFVLAGKMPTKERAVMKAIEEHESLPVKWDEKELLQISDALDRIIMALAIKDPTLEILLPNGGGRKEVRGNEVITEIGWLLYGFPAGSGLSIKGLLESLVKIAEKTKAPDEVLLKVEKIKHGLQKH